MAAPLIHFEYDVLYDTLFVTACGADNTGKNVTLDHAQVTCRKCLTALGYEVAPLDQTTVVESDPLLRRAA